MSDINNRFIWLGGKIVLLQDAKINILSPTAQFGANVFEGIRCYWNDDEEQLFAFRLSDHYKRLKNSIKMFRMEDIYSIEVLKKALIDVVRANNYKEDIAVRQTVFVDGFGTWSSTGPVNMFVSPIPKSRTLVNDGTGLTCCISSWERINDKNLSPKIKAGANYMNSRMAQLEALQNGYDAAIFLNAQGKIAEAPGACFFMIREGVLITPPVSASVLESITRSTIIHLAENILNMKVLEREIDRTELYICEEAFLCGSAMEITPIASVDRIDILRNNHENWTKKLLDIYQKTVSGKIEEYRKWLTPIY